MIPEYSEDFRRDVADEAHFRTSDGFENLARRRGVRVERVFAWHNEFFRPPPRPFSVMHVWIGTFTGSHDDFWEYVGDDTGTPSQLLADAGLDAELDYDLLCAELTDHPRAVADVLAETVCTPDAVTRAVSRAGELGISSANALVCSGDPELTIPADRDYRGLAYLGALDNTR